MRRKCGKRAADGEWPEPPVSRAGSLTPLGIPGIIRGLSASCGGLINWRAWILHPKKMDPAPARGQCLCRRNGYSRPDVSKVSQGTPSRTGGSRGRSHRITQHEQDHRPGLQKKLLENISLEIWKTQFSAMVIPNKPCQRAFFLDRNRVDGRPSKGYS